MCLVRRYFYWLSNSKSESKFRRPCKRANGTRKLDKHSRWAGHFLLTSLFKLADKPFALSLDSAPLIADMAADTASVSWDLIPGLGEVRGPLRHERVSGMHEGQCWEVKGACWKCIWKGRRWALMPTQCEENFHEETHVVCLLSSLASRAYTGHW